MIVLQLQSHTHKHTYIYILRRTSILYIYIYIYLKKKLRENPIRLLSWSLIQIRSEEKRIENSTQGTFHSCEIMKIWSYGFSRTNSKMLLQKLTKSIVSSTFLQILNFNICVHTYVSIWLLFYYFGFWKCLNSWANA